MPEEGSIAERLARAAQGDRLALQMLLVAYHERLRGFAAARMSSDLRARMEPEDVLQQVYVRALRSIAELEDRGPEAFFGWLRSLLDNALLDAERSVHAAKRDIRREVSPGEAPSAYDLFAGRFADSLTPSRVLARGEVRGLLLAALAGLPPDHRRVLELRYLQGKTPSEVAAALGRSVEAAQMLAVRAVRGLRDALRDLTLSWG